MKQRIQQQIAEILSHPEPDKLPHPRRGVRLAMDIWPLLLRKINDDNLPMRASALTYRTIFAFVPMVFLALVAFKALVKMDAIQAKVTELSHKALGIEDVAGRSGKNDLRVQVDEAIRNICAKAGSIELGGIGVMGSVLLLWAAVSLIVTAEKVFNKVYQSPVERPWHMRIFIYWSAMTLGPLFLVGSAYVTEQFFTLAHGYVGDAPLVSPLLKLCGSLMGMIFTWAILCALYKTLPSVRVGWRPAVIGALVAALGVELLKTALFVMVFAKGKSADPAKAALYGSLAILPIALFWTYIAWFIVLVGLEVAWICQSLGFLQAQASLNRARHAQELLAAESAMLLPAMAAVGQAFRLGKPVAEAQLCRTLHAPGSVVRPLMDKLVKAGFLHDVLGEDGNADGFRDWGLARAPEQIALEDLLDLLPVPNPEVPGTGIMMRSRAAQINAVKGMTLADTI